MENNPHNRIKVEMFRGFIVYACKLCKPKKQIVHETLFTEKVYFN